MGGGKPSGGDIAAFLSYSVLTEKEASKHENDQITKNGNPHPALVGGAIHGGMIRRESQNFLKNFAGTHIPFPNLTEEEKRSPLGMSMMYVMGLFSSLSQQLMNARRDDVMRSHNRNHRRQQLQKEGEQLSLVTETQTPKQPQASSTNIPRN